MATIELLMKHSTRAAKASGEKSDSLIGRLKHLGVVLAGKGRG